MEKIKYNLKILRRLAELSTLFAVCMNNGLLCLADKAWPDLSCHLEYSSNFIEQAHAWCVHNLNNGNVLRINSCFTRQCCMLHMMGVLHLYRRGTPPVEIRWMETKEKEYFREILSGEMQKPVGLAAQYNDEKLTDGKVNRIVENVNRCHPSCSTVLLFAKLDSYFILIVKVSDVHHALGLPDSEWDSLYNCVQSALVHLNAENKN